MRRIPLIATAVVLTVVLAACSSSKSNDSAETGTTSTTAASTTTGPSTDGTTPVDDASFATGLGWFFSTSDSGAQNVPPAVTSCIRAKLSDDDATTIVAIKSNDDSNNVADAVGIRVVRDAAQCDRPWLATFLGDSVSLNQLGATSADQQSCVTSSMIDEISGLDDSTATGTGGSGLNAAVGKALTSCVTVAQGLSAILGDPSNSIPPAQVDCIAQKAAQSLTWTQIIAQDSEVQSTIQSAMQACSGQT